MKKLLVILLVLTVAVSLVACANDEPTVEPAAEEPAPIVITGDYVLTEGEVLQLKVAEGTATWATSAQSVATVDATGKVTAVGAGEAVLTATVGEQTKSVSVRVSAKEVIHAYSEGVCLICGEADPDYVAPEIPVKYYGGLAESTIAATKAVSNFASAMDAAWNIGWNEATIAATETKVDFTKAQQDAEIWHVTGIVENGGWCASLYDGGATNIMYNKVKLSDVLSCNAFRIWGAVTGFPYRAYNGSVKVSFILKTANGYIEYVPTVTNLAAGYANNFDGSYSWSLPETVFTENASIPGLDNGDGMMIYDLAAFKAFLKSANVTANELTVSIQFTGETVNNTEDANDINQFGLEAKLLSHFGVKRIMFLA